MNTEDAIAENERLRKEITDLEVQLRAAERTLRRAKDISPIERPTLKRVMQLAREACLTVQRVKGGWMLKIGDLSRRFKRLREIWELLITDNWVLTELFHTPEPVRVRRVLPRPLLRRNLSIAPLSFGNDLTFTSTS